MWIQAKSNGPGRCLRKAAKRNFILVDTEHKVLARRHRERHCDGRQSAHARLQQVTAALLQWCCDACGCGASLQALPFMYARAGKLVSRRSVSMLACA